MIQEIIRNQLLKVYFIFYLLNIQVTQKSVKYETCGKDIIPLLSIRLNINIYSAYRHKSDVM